MTSGTRDPDHVHPEHARLDHPHQDEAGVRAPPLRLKAQDCRRPHLQKPCRIPGTDALKLSPYTAKAHDSLTHIALSQETLNFWKQLSHVLKYFRAEEDPKATLPKSFIAGFLQVRSQHQSGYVLLA